MGGDMFSDHDPEGRRESLRENAAEKDRELLNQTVDREQLRAIAERLHAGQKVPLRNLLGILEPKAYSGNIIGY